METCKSGSEGGCRKPVVYAIRRLCPTLRSACKYRGKSDHQQFKLRIPYEPVSHGQKHACRAAQPDRGRQRGDYECGTGMRAYPYGQTVHSFHRQVSS